MLNPKSAQAASVDVHAAPESCGVSGMSPLHLKSAKVLVAC